MRNLISMFACVVLAGCGDDTGTVVSGNAFSFIGYYGIEGGTVTVLEDTSITTTTSGADGAFRVEGLPSEGEVTLVLTANDFYPIQTGTLAFDATGLERVTFQAVYDALFDVLADGLMVTPDPGRCQIATTVTRVGKSIYDKGAHGEAGATVTIDPVPGDGAEGPIYFDASVMPDRTLTETSEDGGVLFVNVPPGRYMLRASKPGITFREVIATCRAGLLVNASPPWGLQAL